MRKSHITLAMLFAATSLSGMAAMTEAEFNSAKETAIAKMISWSTASPFTPESFEQGIAGLNSLKFSDFDSGDAAVEGVNTLVSSTLEVAREEFNTNLPTIFVTMTTDALKANPVDGKSLFGSMNTIEMLDMDSVWFETYDKACQASAWHLYSQIDNHEYYGMRNNMCYYLRMYEKDGKTLFQPWYSYEYQPYFKIDFADNGKFKMCLEDGRYMGTDAQGGMTVYDEFCDAASWSFTRAYGPQCDMPMLSTKSDPKYYMIRNVYDPNAYLTSAYPDSRFLEVGKAGDKAMWYFSEQTVCHNDWIRCTNKDGSVLYRPDDNGHAQCGPLPGNGKAYMTFIVADEFEDLGLLLFLNYQCRYQMTDNFRNPSSHLLCYDTTISPGVEVDVTYLNSDRRDDKRYLWTIESGSDAGLVAFLESRDEAVATLTSYKNAQPWAQDAISRVIDDIEGCNYGDYESCDAAIADIEIKISDFLATLPGLMFEEAVTSDVRFTLNNVRREQSQSEAGWMVTTVNGQFANTTVSDSDGSVWEIEAVTDNSFHLKNLEGYYVGTMKSGNNTAITQDASEAAKLTFKLVDGHIQFNGGRSCLSLDDSDGVLMASPASDPGTQWTLGKKIVINDDWLEYSTFANAISYEITSLANPELYLEGSPTTWYLTVRNYFNEECYWYFEKCEDGNGCYIINTPYGKTRTRIWWWRGDGNPCMFDDTADERASYDDRWYLIPVDHESNSDEQRAYQISSNYPPTGNSCISVEKNQVGCLNMKPASEKEITTWIFKKLGGLDHERIFMEQLVLKIPIIEGAIAAQPWARDLLDPAYERLTNCTMNDFGPDCYTAINELTEYVNDVMEKVDMLLEEEPDGCAVTIKNVRRDTSGNPAYLASVDGHLNTLDNTDANIKAITWTFEYYSNGRYRLVNDNGEYMGPLEGNDISVTTNRNEAGYYALKINGNTMSLIVRNEPGKGLNLDNAGGNACVYNANDAGSQWVIELVRQSGIDTISAGEDDNRYGLYDLRGIRVNPENAAKGIYIERQGNKVIKRVIK